jgi:hypothetical protein
MLIVFSVITFVRPRITHYRTASRTAAGAVTDFLGELFGVVQAVQVAGA